MNISVKVGRQKEGEGQDPKQADQDAAAALEWNEDYAKAYVLLPSSCVSCVLISCVQILSAGKVPAASPQKGSSDHNTDTTAETST